MTRVMLWIVDRPALSIGLILLITAVFATQLSKLEIDTSAEGLMVEKDPAKEYYDKIKTKFGSDNLTIVLVKADDVFANPPLQSVKRLSDAIERIEGVSRVESLTTVNNLKGEKEFLNTEPLVGATVPDDPKALERIRADALGNPVFVGNIVSKDARAAAINVYTDPKPGDKEFNRRFSTQVEELIQKESGAGLSLYQIGTPITKVTFGDFIQEDQRNLVPISLAVLLFILFLAFRMLQGMVIPIVTGLVSIIWGLGWMAIIGIPVNVLTAIIPSLLIAIGFAEDVHMISEYHEGLLSGKEKIAAIRHMASHAALPILITTATTVLGFGSLVTSDITMMIQFGQASALALSSNFVITLALVPALLRLWPVPKRIKPLALEQEAAMGTIPAMMRALGHFNLKYRLLIVVVTTMLSVASLAGWYFLKVNTDFISYFPQSSFIRQRVQDLHASLSGAVNFYLVVETGRDDCVKDPEMLGKIVGLQEFLNGTGLVDKTVSVADYVRKMHREMNNGDPKFEVIPESSDLVAQYLLTLDGKELAKYVDYSYSTANIVVRHNITSSWEMSGLLNGLDQYISQHFSEHVKVRYTGEGILINNAADYMAINEITSFSWTFLVIGLLHSLLFTSLLAGFLSLIPNVIPILFNFGLMGLLDIPLNTGTALIATIAIGIAVDDTVHHMVRYSRELNEHHDQKVAMFNTMKAQGRPIIYISLALAGGFLVLIFSNFVPTFYFGILSALVMLFAAVTELMITPILMYSTRLVTLWDLLLLKMSPDLVRTAPLFRNLNRWEARKVVLLGRLRALNRGDYLIRKGEAGAELYMVVTGRARATHTAPDGTTQTLATFGPGQVLGEMGALEGLPRSANVVADEPTEVLTLDFAALERIRRRFPFTGAKLFLNLARLLSERLRAQTDAYVRTSDQSALGSPAMRAPTT
jgi:hydrophobe/amphiphile efflux-3 (HAE3) family protein